MRHSVFLRGGPSSLLAAFALAITAALYVPTGAGARNVAARPAPVAIRQAPNAIAHRTCGVPETPGALGPTYVESLSVSGTTCGNGEKTIRAYNSCRLHSGGVTGYCRSRVDGFSCKEKRYTGSSVQFIAKVTCTRSGESVGFSYSEDT